MPTHDQSTADPTREQIAHEASVTFSEASGRPEFVELYARMRATLDEEQQAMVCRMVRLAEEATSDLVEADLWRVVEGVARHFPGQAPAIRAVARHMHDAEDAEWCGLLGAAATVGIPSEEWAECTGPRRPAA